MSVIFRFVILVAICSLPGLALILFGAKLQAGLPVAALGFLVGIVLAHPGVSIGRTVRLLLGLIIKKNVPFVGDRITESMDQNGSDEKQNCPDDRLLTWLLSWDVEKRRGWIVLIGFLVGLLIGIIIAILEYHAITTKRPGIILTEPVKDPETLFIMFPFAASIWSGSLVGIFASAAYRRPILFCGTFAAFVSGCLGLSIGSFPGLMFVATTGALGIALFCASLAALDKPSRDEPINPDV